MSDDKQFDDFEDDFDDFEDVEYNEDEWNEFAEDPVAEQPVAQPKKRGGLGDTLFRIVSFLVIVAFVGVAGVFVYNKYGKSLFRQQQPFADEQIAETEETVDEDFTLDINPINTIDNDRPDDLNNDMGFGDDLPPMPTPMDARDVTQTSDQQTQSDDALDLTPIPDLDNIDAEPLPSLDMSEPEVATQEAPQTLETPVNAEPKKIDLQDNRIVTAALEKENKELTVELSEAQNALDMAQMRIKDLEQQLKKQLSAEKPSPQPRNTSTAKSDTLKREPKITVNTPARPSPKAAAKRAPKPVNDWVLRSAKPGEAIIARKNSSTLKSVNVGTPVAGIGRVQSISNASGQWVIQGTQGQISQ